MAEKYNVALSWRMAFTVLSIGWTATAQQVPLHGVYHTCPSDSAYKSPYSRCKVQEVPRRGSKHLWVIYKAIRGRNTRHGIITTAGLVCNGILLQRVWCSVRAIITVRNTRVFLMHTRFIADDSEWNKHFLSRHTGWNTKPSKELRLQKVSAMPLNSRATTYKSLSNKQNWKDTFRGLIWIQVTVAAWPPFWATEIDHLQLNSQKLLTSG